MSSDERRCATCGHGEPSHRADVGGRCFAEVVLYAEPDHECEMLCACPAYVPEERRSMERRTAPKAASEDRMWNTDKPMRRRSDRRASAESPRPAFDANGDPIQYPLRTGDIPAERMPAGSPRTGGATSAVGGEARAVTHSVERTSPMGGEFVGTCRLCGAIGLTPADVLKPCPNPAGLTRDEAVLDAIEGAGDGGSLVERLAARYEEWVGQQESFVEADHARFFLLAIADEILTRAFVLKCVDDAIGPNYHEAQSLRRAAEYLQNEASR